MAAIFPKSSDRWLRIGGAIFAVAIFAVVGLYIYFSYPTVIDTGYSPTQPVPYSHKLHAGDLGIDCYYCHSTVSKAAFAAVPATATCMNCHAKVRTDSPRLEKVRQSYASGQPIPWVKIHSLPDYVYFNHQAHLSAGVSCISCHGRIDQMTEVKQAKPLNMGFCLECHRNPAANLRPAEYVTKLDWQPERNPAEYGRELIAAKHINPPTNCSGCHR
jgi:hypothetical protein